MKDSLKDDRHTLRQAELSSQLKLINVAEIEILQAVLLIINTQYFKERQYIEPALVCALILNHELVPSLYATSHRGYLKQQQEYNKKYKNNIQAKLVNRAIEEVLQQNCLRTLKQDVVMSRNTAFKQCRVDSWRQIKQGNKKTKKTGNSDIFDLLANLSLIDLTEGEVIADAYSHIQSEYKDTSDRLDLSDICALVLNHESVPTLYATNAKEYNQHKQSYLSTYQPKVRKVIRQVVKQVNLEGSEHSFTANATIAKNQANARNMKSWKNSSA